MRRFPTSASKRRRSSYRASTRGGASRSPSRRPPRTLDSVDSALWDRETGPRCLPALERPFAGLSQSCVGIAAESEIDTPSSHGASPDPLFRSGRPDAQHESVLVAVLSGPVYVLDEGIGQLLPWHLTSGPRATTAHLWRLDSPLYRGWPWIPALIGPTDSCGGTWSSASPARILRFAPIVVFRREDRPGFGGTAPWLMRSVVNSSSAMGVAAR